MSTRNLRLDSADVIQGDHQRLEERLDRLHEQLSSATLTRAQADRELSRMEAELEEHFALEELGGFFAEILESSPERADRVRELLRQHTEFRAIFRSLRRTCRWACGESGARAGWLAEFADFHRRYDEHECAEHELLYEAMQRDLGAGD
jgi:DNA repair exonuclease SbcCD ATPase subunit